MAIALRLKLGLPGGWAVCEPVQRVCGLPSSGLDTLPPPGLLQAMAVRAMIVDGDLSAELVAALILDAFVRVLHSEGREVAR